MSWLLQKGRYSEWFKPLTSLLASCGDSQMQCLIFICGITVILFNEGSISAFLRSVNLSQDFSSWAAVVTSVSWSVKHSFWPAPFVWHGEYFVTSPYSSVHKIAATVLNYIIPIMLSVVYKICEFCRFELCLINRIYQWLWKRTEQLSENMGYI